MASPRRKTHHYDQPEDPIEPQQRATIVTMPAPQFERETRQPQQAPERIGDILRRAREKRGDDLQQIADYLCIRRNFLIALEGSHYEQFPADAYVIGFLRTYAEFLGLNGKEVIDYYRREMAGRRRKPALVMPTPISEGKAPSGLLLAGAAIGALLVYILWYALSTSDRASVSTPPALPTVTTDAPTAIAVPGPAPQETPAIPLPRGPACDARPGRRGSRTCANACCSSAFGIGPSYDPRRAIELGDGDRRQGPYGLRSRYEGGRYV